MNTLNDPDIKIIYKNDLEARTKLIDFIIHLLIESTDVIGDVNVSKLRRDEIAGDTKDDI